MTQYPWIALSGSPHRNLIVAYRFCPCAGLPSSQTGTPRCLVGDCADVGSVRRTSITVGVAICLGSIRAFYNHAFWRPFRYARPLVESAEDGSGGGIRRARSHGCARRDPGGRHSDRRCRSESGELGDDAVLAASAERDPRPGEHGDARVRRDGRWTQRHRRRADTGFTMVQPSSGFLNNGADG